MGDMAEIKAIADYLKDIEEGLYEWNYRGKWEIPVNIFSLTLDPND